MKQLLRMAMVFFAAGGLALAQTAQLVIEWDPNSEPDIHRYRLQRAVNSPANFADLQEPLHPLTQVTDTDIAPGNLYVYRVAAIDAAGNQSLWSTPVTVGLPRLSLSPGSVSTGRDTLIAIASFLSDPDDDVAGLQLEISQQNQVQVTMEGENIRLTPVPQDYTGPAAFRIRAVDPHGFDDVAEVSFTYVTAGSGGTNIHIAIPDVRFAEDAQFQMQMDSVVSLSSGTPAQLSWTFGDAVNLSLSFDSANRLLTLKAVQPDWFGEEVLTATAEAPDGTRASAQFSVTITPINDPPVLHITQLNLSADPAQNVFDLKTFASDVDHSPAELGWEFFGFTEFSFTWENEAERLLRVAALAGATSQTGTFRVSDPAGGISEATVTVTAAGSGGTPISIDIPDQTFSEDESVVIKLDEHVSAPGLDPAALFWSFSGGPALRYTFRADARTLTVQSQAPNWFGEETIQATVTTPDQQTASAAFRVTITPVNDPPMLNVEELYISAASNNQFDLKLYADDVDDPVASLSWEFIGFSQFAFEWVDPAQKIVAITPTGSVQLETGTMRVTDPAGAATERQVTVFYMENNTPPHLLFAGPIVVPEDSSVALDLGNYVVDSTNTPRELSWSFEAPPELVVQFDPAAYRLTIQPVPDWFGEASIIFTVRDPLGATDSRTVPVQVPERNGIRNLTVTRDGMTVNLRFVTEMPSQTELRYWHDSSSPETLWQSELRTQHAITLGNLLPNTRYFYQLTVIAADNRPLSVQDSLTTGNLSGPPAPDDLVVYPNPVKPAHGHNEMIFINLPAETRRIELYSLVGEKVHEVTVDPSIRAEYRINMRENTTRMPSGVYVFLLRDENSRVIRQNRVVVIR